MPDERDEDRLPEDEAASGQDEPAAEADETLLDKLRAVPVGTNDPNIVGDAGPLDVPPGRD